LAIDPLLRVDALEAGYGKVGVLHGVDLVVRPAEIVALLGPNGAGKTTLLRALSGLLPWTAGEAAFAGHSLRGVDPRACARAGLVHVVEGHRVFTQLSVADNLALAAYDLPRRLRSARVEEALQVFPEIAAKRHEKGGALSGGQQQMLAVAQGLVRAPGCCCWTSRRPGSLRCWLTACSWCSPGCARRALRSCWSSSSWRSRSPSPTASTPWRRAASSWPPPPRRPASPRGWSAPTWAPPRSKPLARTGRRLWQLLRRHGEFRPEFGFAGGCAC